MKFVIMSAEKYYEKVGEREFTTIEELHAFSKEVAHDLIVRFPGVETRYSNTPPDCGEIVILDDYL
jgi:hypothetical protein